MPGTLIIQEVASFKPDNDPVGTGFHKHVFGKRRSNSIATSSRRLGRLHPVYGIFENNAL